MILSIERDTIWGREEKGRNGKGRIRNRTWLACLVKPTMQEKKKQGEREAKRNKRKEGKWGGMRREKNRKQEV